MNQKEAKNERENALLPHSVKFVNHVFQIILFYIGKQRVIVGKYKPYCLINLNFTQNVGLLV